MRWVEYESLFKGGGKSWESADFYGCALFFFSLSLVYFFFFFSQTYSTSSPSVFHFSFLSHSTHPPLNSIYALCILDDVDWEKKTSLIVVSVDVSLSLSHFAVFISILLLLFSLCFCDSFFFRGESFTNFYSLSFVYEQRPQKVRLFVCCCCFRVSFSFYFAGENYFFLTN